MTGTGREALRLIMISVLWAAGFSATRPADWLIDPSPFKARITKDDSRKEIALDNGLIRRVFRLAPNAATVDFRNLMTGESILRAVRPEATVGIDGRSFEVGGLVGQPEHAYLLPEWLDSMTADPAAFRFREARLGQVETRLAWKRKRPAAESPWPPPGLSLTLDFGPPAAAGAADGVSVSVHYEIYDGLPLLAKWLSVANGGPDPITLNSFISEILAVVEARIDGRKPRTLDSAEHPRRERLRLPGELGRRGKQNRALGSGPGLRDPGQLQEANALPPRVPAAARARGPDRAGRDLRDLPDLRARLRLDRPGAEGPGPAPDVPDDRALGHRESRSSCTSARPTRRSCGRPSTSAPKSGSRWSS